MRIGFVIDDSLDRTDGVQQYCLTLGKWLAKQGHAVSYLSGQSGRNGTTNVYSLSKNIKVRFNKNTMSVPLYARRRSIRRLVSSDNFDLIHVQIPNSPIMSGQVVKQAAKQGIAVFGTFHILPYGRSHYIAAKIWQLAMKRSLVNYVRIFSVSEPARQFAQSIGVSSTVLPNVVDVSEYGGRRTKNWRHNKNFKIVFVGRLVPRKGCLQLLRSVNNLVTDNSIGRIEVIVCGSGPQMSCLREWAKRHGLERVVKFKGYVSENAKKRYLAQANLAVFPSLGGESFGIVLLEAMAAGAGAVLGGNNAGYRSVLKPVPATLFDPNDPAQLSSLIRRFYDNPKELDKVHLTQQKVLRRYDVSIVGKKLVSYYQAVLNKNK